MYTLQEMYFTVSQFLCSEDDIDCGETIEVENEENMECAAETVTDEHREVMDISVDHGYATCTTTPSTSILTLTSNLGNSEAASSSTTNRPAAGVPDFNQHMFDNLPQLTEEEENISVYLAGYLCYRAKSKFECGSCHKIWQATDDERTQLSSKFIFFNRKKYTDTSQLFPPSSILLKTTEEMERVFRHMCPTVIDGSNVKNNLLRAVDNSVNFQPSICSPECSKSAEFMKNVYVMMRLNYKIKIFNRLAKDTTKSRTSRKLMKLSHL